jgi:putative methyltransferase
MSLYYEAEAALKNSENAGGSLKSRVYNNKNAKVPPARIFALVAETIKWSPYLKEVVEKADLLKYEKKVFEQRQLEAGDSLSSNIL